MKIKKISFLFYCVTSLFVSLTHSQFLLAQKFAGMTLSGGPSGGGSIYRINADGSQYTEIKDFEVGTNYPTLALGKDGALYGTTYLGGSKGFGTIFKMNTDGTNYKTLYEFDIPGGSPSYLLHASDGKLYGITNHTNQPTTLYSINVNGTGFSVIKSFGPNATIGELFEAANGKIYALSTTGGLNNSGSLFSISKDGSGYSVIQSFPIDGPVIVAALIQDSNGDIYGVAPGGSDQAGIIFTMKSDGTGFTKLYDFIGQFPNNTLTLGSDGNLYGAASGGQNGAGMIFTIKKDGSNFQKIYDLTLSDGSYFRQQLLQDNNGFLYGVTVTGGPLAAGVIFKIKTNGSSYQKIYDFENNTGMGQYSGQIITTNNIIYGINSVGAAYGAGNIFSIHPDGSGYTNLHDFGGAIGTYPYGNLIQGVDSLLYGTTYSGGAHNLGTIFSIDGNGKNYKKLYDFDGLSGANPYEGLTQAPDGYLYGTASSGGTGVTGTIYKIKPDGTGFTKLLDFDDYNGKGLSPFASPILGLDGKLYGMAYQGGLNGSGIIYSIKTDGSGFTKLIDFSSSNGESPYSSLIQGSDGTLYGMTPNGGIHSRGVIFSIKPSGTGYTKLHEFDNQTDGIGPYGSLLLGKDGKLYGVTQYGGANSSGTVFSITTDGNQFKKLSDFDGSSGGFPIGTLIQPEDGNLYGITSSNIFTIHTDGSGLKKIFDFPATYGDGITRQNSLVSLKLRKQSIHFDPIQEVTQGQTPFNLSASASSGLPIIFSSSTNTIATINGKAVTIVNPGKATIVATQPGDGAYDIAAPVAQSFCIDPLKPTVSISGGGPSLALNSSSSGGYQWFFNNSPIAGATNQSLPLSSPGNYAVKVSVDNCFSPLSDVFVITEIMDKNQDLEISVYPNPSKSSINLNLESLEQGAPAEVTIFNTLGQQMDYLTFEGGKTASIDISKYPNGNFIVMLTNAEKIYHSKFIKY